MPDYSMTKVDLQAMQNVANSISEKLELLERELDLTALAENTTGFWKGQDQVAFRNSTASFTLRQQQDLLKKYRALNDNLKDAIAEFARADDDVKQIVARLKK